MDWYRADVDEAIKKRLACTYKPDTIFYGSSTLRLWDSLYEDFARYKPVNLAFGGSTLAACVWFFEEIVTPVKAPKKLILYAGDNDLGDGRHPEEVFIFFKQFQTKLREYNKSVPLYFVSVKPSLEREEIMDNIIYTNKLIEEDIQKSAGNDFFVNVFERMLSTRGKPSQRYFDEDGLHMNKGGYDVWKEAFKRQIFNER